MQVSWIEYKCKFTLGRELAMSHILLFTLFRQIHAMGFPAERVVRTCKALGEDSQKIIHFCLLVDQFVEKDKFPEEEVSRSSILIL